MPQPQSQTPSKHNVYRSDYSRKSVRHHEWRTASNSATYLLPTLREKAQAQPALTLLDVGAGSGTITAGLAACMPHGRVTALDLSAEILEDAMRHAEEMGVQNVASVTGSVYGLPFEDGSFDVVHASMILAHLDAPVDAVREMLRVVKRGGLLALRESDLRAWSVWPDYPGLRETNRLQCQVHLSNGGSVDAGQRLVSWVMAAGVPREKITASAGTWCYSTPEEREMWGEVMADRDGKGNVRRKALEMGWGTQGDFERMSQDWERWIQAEDGWFASMHGEVLVQL